MIRKPKKHRTPRRRQKQSSAALLNRGIVALSIGAGACMWGYALINLASRTL